MKIWILLLFAVFSWQENPPADAIIGEYWTAEKTGKIAIYKCGTKYCGRIVWRQTPRKDSKNPDKTKRDQNVVGLQFLNDFNYETQNQQWVGGTVYSIDNGNTYKGKIWLEKDGKELKMRGFIGVSLFGRTATLTRVQD